MLTEGAIDTLRPRRNEQHFADDIFKHIFFNENVWIFIKISLKFVPKGPINNIPALVQIMAWCRSGDKPLSEPMMVSLLTHICVTQPQWINNINAGTAYLIFVYFEAKISDLEFFSWILLPPVWKWPSPHKSNSHWLIQHVHTTLKLTQKVCYENYMVQTMFTGFHIFCTFMCWIFLCADVFVGPSDMTCILFCVF